MSRAALKADPAVVSEMLRPSPIMEVVWAAREVADAGWKLATTRNDPESRVIREACQSVYDSALAHFDKVRRNV